MQNRQRPHPCLDVDGGMTYLATKRGAPGEVHRRDFHLRLFDDGWMMVDAGGVTYPVPPEMTAWAYIQWLFAADVEGRLDQASGE